MSGQGRFYKSEMSCKALHGCDRWKTAGACLGHVHCGHWQGRFRWVVLDQEVKERKNTNSYVDCAAFYGLWWEKERSKMGPCEWAMMSIYASCLKSGSTVGCRSRLSRMQ